MIFFEYQFQLLDSCLPFECPVFTPPARRRNRDALIVTRQKRNVVTLSHIIFNWHEAEPNAIVYFMEHNMQGTLLRMREMCAEEFADSMLAAEKMGSISSLDDVLNYFRLESYSPRASRKGIAEYTAEMYSEAELHPTGAMLQETRLIRMLGSLTPPRFYLLETADVSRAERQIELLMNVYRQEGMLPSGRLCKLTLSELDMSPAEMKDLFFAQDSACLLIRMDEACTDEARQEELTLRLTRLSRLAAKAASQVRVFFMVPPPCSRFLPIIEAAADGKIALVRLGARASGTKKKDLPEAGETHARKDSNIPIVFLTDEEEKEAPAPKKPPKAPAPPKKSAMDALQELIGLEDAKRVIGQAVDYGRAQKLYASRGFSTAKMGMHMTFSGNPGTAKTTVARLAAQIFRENGILSKGGLVEVGRSDLVQQYVGWTAKHVKEKFREARGSVLFIDEAYSLLDDREGQYGDEAINTIVQEMENNREDLVVIFAGYREPMEQLMERNAGLRSRVTFHVDFPDYSTDELVRIFRLQLEQRQRTVSPETEAQVRKQLERAAKQPDFGNGRYVRTMVERAMLAQASRLMARPEAKITDEDIRELTAEDLRPEPEAQTDKPMRTIGFAV